MKYLKTIGLAILAIVAVSAVSGVASASAAEFRASAVGLALDGEQATSHKFTVTGSSITCTSAVFTGTTKSLATTTQEMHPAYSGCTAFGFVGATVNTTGCQYIFHTQTSTVDLESCTNGGIVVEASSAFGKCVMDVPNQTGINGQSWATGGTAPNRDILATSNATNVHVTVTTSTGICPISVGTHTNGTYTGTTTVKATGGEVWYA
jgi:hypothetical protein